MQKITFQSGGHKKKGLLRNLPRLMGLSVFLLIFSLSQSFAAEPALTSLHNVDFSNPANQNPVTIKGKVTDKTNAPLVGVSIIIQGTSMGTTTDYNGNYSITVKTGQTLVFSFVGYKKKAIIVGKQTVINITLSESVTALNQVVVIGYGVQKKATLTGSVVSVKGSVIQKVPATDLSTTLAGRLPGLIVNTRGSSPGNENVQIAIRGKSTWMGGGPLIIVDGIPNRSGWERISPNDIASISILKDASAAIYGSRAANGVILITTKRGKVGKPVIKYTTDFGFTTPSRVVPMSRSWQFATYFTEAKRPGYIWTPEEITKFKVGADPNLYPNYNLEDYVFAPFALQTKHSLSLSGGSDAVKYFVSARYLYKDSFYKGGVSDFNSYNITSNIDAKVTKNFSVSVNLMGRRDDIISAVGSETMEGTDIGFFDQMLVQDPTKPIFWENGLPAPTYGNNIVEDIEGKRGTNNRRSFSLNSLATAKWNLPFITEGLYIKGTAAYDFVNTRVNQFSHSYDLYAFNNSTGKYTNLNTNPVLNRSLWNYFYNSYHYTLRTRLGYSRTFGKHSVDAFIAYEQFSSNDEWIDASRSSFLTDQLPFLFAGDPTTAKNNGSGADFAYLNYFGRIAYNYQGKYLLDFTLRRDESVKFAKNHRVGWFPGISAGWRIDQEPFMKKGMPFVDDLKLKASYGQMGSDNVGNFQYLATAALYGTFNDYVLGTNPAVVPTLHFTGTPNPLITWEIANSYNVAVVGSLWKNMLGFDLEYFYSKRSNILTTRRASVPSYTGMILPMENIGKAQNQGFSIMLSTKKNIGNFSWFVSGNFTYTANKILYMDESPLVPDYQRQEGHPIDSWLLYEADGIFNTQKEFDDTKVKLPGAQLGDIKYVDVNGDGVIDNKDRVRQYKSSLPKIIFGMNFTFNYKRFELDMLWQGQGKAWTYIEPVLRNGDINIPLWMYDKRWTPANAENATMPRAFYHRSERNNTLLSTFWLKDARFLRLKSMQISYTLPEKILSKVSIKNLRVYVSGLNLLLFSKMKNYDPEVVNSLGVFYPATKAYNIGLNVSF